MTCNEVVSDVPSIRLDKTAFSVLFLHEEGDDFGFDVPDADMLLEEKRIIRLGVPPFRTEGLTTISGVSFETCYEQRVVDERY